MDAEFVAGSVVRWLSEKGGINPDHFQRTEQDSVFDWFVRSREAWLAGQMGPVHSDDIRQWAADHPEYKALHLAECCVRWDAWEFAMQRYDETKGRIAA